ncbi:hypothetical protein [Streptomyces sp. T028]|uniref:hypothetical protein n=1 Tax=Streptomyces sp. T028 TaxID=3394379 RepID=UPI003A859B79
MSRTSQLTQPERLARHGPVPDDPRTLLQQQGPRCTASRLHTLSLLPAPELHLSVAQACERLTLRGGIMHPTTVYRTLRS